MSIVSQSAEECKPAGEQKKPGYWAVLPAQVRYDPQIPPNAKLLYAEISSLTDARGYCYAANAYFEQLYELSERTISRLIRTLAEAGYIRVEDDGGGKDRRKIYAGVNPLAVPPGNLDKNVYTPRQNCRGGIDKNVYQNKKENRKEDQSPQKPPEGAGADYVPKEAPDWKPERFAAFWKFYPLHTSKQAAIRAWDKLKPSDELLAVIGKALRRQIAEKQARGEEWKIYASTYLNGARWTDEDAAARQGRTVEAADVRDWQPGVIA